MYPEELVIPMKEELTENGFKDLTTPEQVVEALGQKGTTLLVINSVCGCSAVVRSLKPFSVSSSFIGITNSSGYIILFLSILD